MIKLLNEISESPGILGSCIYSTLHGVMASNLPLKLTFETQRKVGDILHQIFSLKMVTELKVGSFEIQYDESLLLARQLDAQTAIFILCQPNANMSMINMALNMLSEDLVKEISTWRGPEICEAQHTAQEQAAPAATTQLSYAEVMNGPLAAEMKLIKAALSKRIGPFSGIVLEDGINEWLSLGKSQPGDLISLVSILARDIEDEALRQTFVSDLTNLFGH